ncbi:MAG: hypothetical protein ACWGQW_06985 [bacterium]
MPSLAFNRNIRKERTRRREPSWLYLAGEGIASTPLEISASATIAYNGASAQTVLVPSEVAIGMYDGDTGREMKIKYEVTAYLEMSVPPADVASEFEMVRRVSPTMPTPTIDSNGKPT